MGSIATDGVSSNCLRHWLTEKRANRLWDIAQPEDVELSDRSAAKKTDDDYQGKGCIC